MKKRFVSMVLSLLLFSLCGCNQSITESQPITENQQAKTSSAVTESQSTEESQPVTESQPPLEIINGYETARGEYNEYFVLQVDDFKDAFNDSIEKKGYEGLEILSSSDTSASLTDNGETWCIYIKRRSPDDHKYDLEGQDGTGCIESLELSLFSEGEEDAKINGDYLYSLINLFSPGLQEEICDQLYIFEQAPEGYPRVRTLLCGNVKYIYSYDEGNEKYSSSSFHVRPAEIEYIPESTPRKETAIRPQA